MHFSPRVGQIDATTVKNVHFGGFSDEDEGDDDGVRALSCPYTVPYFLS